MKAVADPANASIFFVIKLLIQTDSTHSNNTDYVLQHVTEIFDYYVNDFDRLFCIFLGKEMVSLFQTFAHTKVCRKIKIYYRGDGGVRARHMHGAD